MDIVWVGENNCFFSKLSLNLIFKICIFIYMLQQMNMKSPTVYGINLLPVIHVNRIVIN